LELTLAGNNHGKAWATAAFAVGISTSVACNVAHTYLPPVGAANWHPYPGAIAMAAFWPVALLLAIEVIARVGWPHGKWWAVVRYGGLTTVAAIAALLSYKHMSALMSYYGEDSLSAIIGPLAIDGLMAVSTAALLALGRVQAPPSVLEAPQAVPEVANALSGPVSVPEADPPPTTRQALNGQQDGARRRNLEARKLYRDSVASGLTLTGKELGERYGMSSRWGRWIARTAKSA